MPNVKKHCEISRQRTGKTFWKLHSWIDNPHKYLGVNHRRKRHAFTLDDVSEIGSFWGSRGLTDKAIVEWLFHIAIDNLETAFKRSKRCYGNNRYNYFKIGFSESGEIYLECKHLREKALEAIFTAKK